MTTNRNLKSTLRAAALSLALAFGMTAGHSVLTPDTAQAGIVSGVKKAAKAVGGGVKKAAVTVGSRVKAAGVGIGRDVKRGAVAVARSPVAKPFKDVGKTVYSAGKRVVKAVR